MIINYTTLSNSGVNNLKEKFAKMILHVNSLLITLPDYHYDPKQMAENLELLQFDKNIPKIT